MDNILIQTWLIIEVFTNRIYFSVSYPNKKEVAREYKILKNRHKNKRFKISLEKAEFQNDPELLKFLLE